MKTLSSPTFRLLFSLCAVLAYGLLLFPQETRSAGSDGSVPIIEIMQGDVFELGIHTTIENPEFSWILTRNHEFLGAQRNRFFQTRQSTPGEYKIDVNIQDAARTRTEHHALRLHILEGSTPRRDVPPHSDIIIPIIRTTPSADASNTVSVPPQGGVVLIDPSESQGNIVRYALSFGEGTDAAQINTGTINEHSGTPLHIYFPPSPAPVRMSVMLVDAEDSAISEDFTITFDGQMNGTMPGHTGNGVGIQIQQEGLSAAFSLAVDPTMIDASRVLYEWDFGDRNRSLLAMPVHTYTAPGIYTVRVTVRDITTAQVIMSGQTQVEVSEPVLPLPPEEPEPEPRNGIGLGGILRAILIMAGLLALAVAAYFVFRLIKNKASGSLQERIEKMEGKLFEGDEKDKNNKEPDVSKDAVAPLALRRDGAKTQQPRETVLAKEKENKEFSTKSGQPEVPPAQVGPVPGWLQGGSSGETDDRKESPSPSATDTLRPTPAPPPPPAGSETTSTSGDAKAPPWLQKNTGVQETPSRATPEPKNGEESAPSSQPVPDTASQREQEENNVSASSSEDTEAPMPDWLRAAQAGGTPTGEKKEASEEEQERKRRKRQRYRQNKKLREQAERQNKVSGESADQPTSEAQKPARERASEGSSDATASPDADAQSSTPPPSPSQVEAPAATDTEPQPSRQDETSSVSAQPMEEPSERKPDEEKAETEPSASADQEPIAMIRIDSLENAMHEESRKEEKDQKEDS